MELSSGGGSDSCQPIWTFGDAKQAMTHQGDGSYRCPKCGATAALRMPQPVPRETHVTLKCLQCAHLLRVPRHFLTGSAPSDSARSLD